MFTIEAIKSMKKSGSLAPSSRFLVEKMTKPIDKHKNIIVEFGTGNGVITEGILDKMSQQSRLFSFELNKKMYQHALTELPDDERLHLINNSALEFDHILQKNGVQKVDLILSSLPLSLLNSKDVFLLLKKCKTVLDGGGMFIQYQYSLGKHELLKRHFSEVRLGFTPLNFPPAIVYYCTK